MNDLDDYMEDFPEIRHRVIKGISKNKNFRENFTKELDLSKEEVEWLKK